MKSLRFTITVGAAGLAACMIQAAPPSSAIVQSEFVYEAGPYPACHASTIVETTQGQMLAAWFGGSDEARPDVCIYVSRYTEGHWTAGAQVADGVQTQGQRYPCWNPVLFQPRNAPLMLFYKVGPSPAKWWGMLITSTNGGHTWSAPQRLPKGVLGPIKNKPIQLADGTILCGSSTEEPEPTGKGWQVQIERTADLGNTWQVVGPLNTKDEFNAIQPSILTYADGRLQILCRTMEKKLVTSWSTDQGRTWSKLTASGLRNPNSGSDAVTLSDGRQLLVYNRRDEAGGAPANIGEADRCPLNVSLSSDGEHWRMVLTLEDKPLPAGYAYPAVIQTRDGLVHVTYTWNREKIKHVVLNPAKL